MKLITIRGQIAEVVRRWHSQYMVGRGNPQPDKAKIYAELLKLDLEHCSAADVERVIGNDSWACPQPCHECGKRYDVVIEVGAEPDYESATTWLCRGCVRNACKLMDGKCP